MGPGSEVVKAKLADEGPGFVEDNRDVFELVIKPYIFLGFIQHLFYWNTTRTTPGTGRARRSSTGSPHSRIGEGRRDHPSRTGQVESARREGPRSESGAGPF